MANSKFLWVKMGRLFFKISKIPLLDSPALSFCRQIAKICQKKKKKKNTDAHQTLPVLLFW
jgi:hypothetical protein